MVALDARGAPGHEPANAGGVRAAQGTDHLLRAPPGRLGADRAHDRRGAGARDPARRRSVGGRRSARVARVPRASARLHAPAPAGRRPPRGRLTVRRRVLPRQLLGTRRHRDGAPRVHRRVRGRRGDAHAPGGAGDTARAPVPRVSVGRAARRPARGHAGRRLPHQRAGDAHRAAVLHASERHAAVPGGGAGARRRDSRRRDDGEVTGKSRRAPVALDGSIRRRSRSCCSTRH